MKNDLKNLEGLILYFGLMLIVRGLWLIIISEERFLASDTYRLMNGLIPQWGWAIFCLTAGMFFLLSLANKHLRYLWMIVSGLLSTVIHILFALATWDATNVSVFIFLNALSAIFSMSIALMGGDSWWRIRKSTRK